MSDLKELYQEVILDHNRQPRNFRILPTANRHAEGFNPLCGDKINIYLELDKDVIKDISFQGEGCAISKASSSMMTQSVKGKKLSEGNQLFEHFHQMITGTPGAPVSPDIGKLAIFSGVCEFPSRVKCASLAWHTLRSALEGKEQMITTEDEVGVAIGEKGVDAKMLNEQIVETLKTCYDPEIPVNIYELGLIYKIDVNEKGAAQIKMTLPSPACPVAGSLPPEVEQKVKKIPGVVEAKVEGVWAPPWKPDMMTEAARLQLGMM